MCLCAHWSLYETTHWIGPPMILLGNMTKQRQHFDSTFRLYLVIIRNRNSWWWLNKLETLNQNFVFIRSYRCCVFYKNTQWFPQWQNNNRKQCFLVCPWLKATTLLVSFAFSVCALQEHCGRTRINFTGVHRSMPSKNHPRCFWTVHIF